MKMTKLKFITCVAFFFNFAVFCSYGFSSGAPSKACNTMEPIHPNSQLQTSVPLYEITAEMIQDSIAVYVKGKQNEQFQGFMVQARDNSGKIITGKFTVEGENKIWSKAVSCDGTDDTWTQTNKSEKTELKSIWTPPPGFSGQVKFRATVLKSYAVYWLGLETKPLYITSTLQSSTSSNIPNQNSVYTGCDERKSCFGQPNNCVARRNCDILLAYAGTQDGVIYELYGKLTLNNIYIAMGLSKDKKMGGDSVTSCINSDNTGLVQHSWNARVGYNNLLSEEPLLGDELGRYEDGNVYCQWQKKHEINVNGMSFNTKNETYYLLLVAGPPGRYDGKGKHNIVYISDDRVNLTLIQAIEAAGKSPLIKVHGSFMVIAWVGFVSFAILMARYYKEVWGEQMLCDVKIWFAFHRGLMFSSVILIIIAFIIIFIYRGGWSKDGSTHAVLGIISTALAIIQPIGALFRPSPQSSKRPIFNWLHWFAGNAGHIIAIITIFFAVNLSAAQLPYGFYGAMAVFVVGYCIIHFILQVHTWKLEKKKSNEVKMMEVGAQNANAAASKDNKEAPGRKFRKLVLGAYGLFAFILVLVLIILICK